MDEWTRVADVATDGKEVRTVKGGEGGSVVGAQARVETSGDIQRRITATRLLLTGPFALAFRKKKDSRALYLTVEGRGWSIVRELKPKDEKAARMFAAAVNAGARSS